MSNAEYYKSCNLVTNPFRSQATLEDDPRLGIWAGQERERALLQKFLARSRAEQVGNTNGLLLYGTYGTGKSHALLWGTRWIKSLNEGGYSSAYYIPTLKKDKGKLTFSSALTDDLVARTTFVQDVYDYRQFLNRMVRQFIDDHSMDSDTQDDLVIEKLIPATELQSFAKEIFHLQGDALKGFLAKDRTDYQAMLLFTRLVNLFVHEIRLKDSTVRFRQSVYLMIDELDVLVSASAKEVIEVNELIRHLYDMCPNCFGLVLALSAELEQLPTVFTEFVLSRMGRQIAFSPLDRQSAVDFAVGIMDSEQMRISTDDKSKLGAYPFTQAALEAVLGELADRTPRKIVNVLQQLIEEARLAELDPVKGPITVERLDSSGILDDLI
ncbi:hypothetical protein [Pseudomonas sp. NBRC 111130]|uniref:hypothetical protein n=1 Tax=Pseudomonas sp. NBRC 111130 TaxID=1661045 RepID=UPI001C44515A|nr:hypothetical protein [Pseudomonas sp. NBRC 111130]